MTPTVTFTPAEIRRQMVDIHEAGKPQIAQAVQVSQSLRALSLQYQLETTKEKFPDVKIVEASQMLSTKAEVTPALFDKQIAGLIEAKAAVKLIVFDAANGTTSFYV